MKTIGAVARIAMVSLAINPLGFSIVAAYEGGKGLVASVKNFTGAISVFNSAAFGNYSGAYSFLAGSDLISSVVGAVSGTNVLTTTKSWEFGSRLRGRESAF